MFQVCAYIYICMYLKLNIIISDLGQLVLILCKLSFNQVLKQGFNAKVIIRLNFRVNHLNMFTKLLCLTLMLEFSLPQALALHFLRIFLLTLKVSLLFGRSISQVTLVHVFTVNPIVAVRRNVCCLKTFLNNFILLVMKRVILKMIIIRPMLVHLHLLVLQTPMLMGL